MCKLKWLDHLPCSWISIIVVVHNFTQILSFFLNLLTIALPVILFCLQVFFSPWMHHYPPIPSFTLLDLQKKSWCPPSVDHILPVILILLPVILDLLLAGHLQKNGLRDHLDVITFSSWTTRFLCHISQDKKRFYSVMCIRCNVYIAKCVYGVMCI